MIPEKSFFGADEFEVCFEERVFPYYYGRDQGGYAQSRDSLKQYFLDNFDNKGFTNTTGYLTVRFIINCKGEIGRFDIKEVGTDFKKNQI